MNKKLDTGKGYCGKPRRRDTVLTPTGDFTVARYDEARGVVVCTDGSQTRFIPDLSFIYLDALLYRDDIEVLFSCGVSHETQD